MTMNPDQINSIALDICKDIWANPTGPIPWELITEILHGNDLLTDDGELKEELDNGTILW